MEPIAKRARVSPFPMLGMDEATALIKGKAHLLPTMALKVDQARGFILAEDIFSSEDLPPFEASIMDGYAVVASDGQGDFPVIAPITAGLNPTFEVSPGKIARITTGAPLPPGSDAVVMVEETDVIQTVEVSKETPEGRKADIEEKVVRIKKAVKKGENVRRRGSDIARGEKILEKGAEIGPSEIGVLASVGVKEILVYKKPVVAILSTGEEVVEYTSEPKEAQIRDSNRPTMISLLELEGCKVIDLGIAGDKLTELEQTVMKAFEEADVLITSGGVSMGEADLMKVVLAKIQAEIHFGRVFMKPGKPTTFATIKVPTSTERRLIFSLPGNPVSSVVCFYLFVLPALKKMAGHAFPDLPIVKAKLHKNVKLDPRPEYQRAFLQIQNTSSGTHFVAMGTGGQVSSRLMSMRTANALLRLPPGSQGDSLKEGEFVDALLIGNLKDFS